MSKLNEIITDFANNCMEVGLHAKTSDQAQEELDAYIDDAINNIKNQIFAPLLELGKGKHAVRTQDKQDLWLRILTDYSAGIPAEQIAKRYYNEQTGKHYTRGYVYWVIDRCKQPDMLEQIKSLNTYHDTNR
jgi:hypothetical protein